MYYTTDSNHQQILKYRDHATFSVTIFETHTLYIVTSMMPYGWLINYIYVIIYVIYKYIILY